LDILDLDINKLTKLLQIQGPEYNQVNFDALMAVLEAAKGMQPDQMINLIIKIAEFVTETRFDFKKMMSITKETKLEKGEYI
jgi:fructose/tagatose bisphosphate aldolase